MRAGHGVTLHLGLQASSSWVCAGIQPAQRVTSRSEHPRMRAGHGVTLHLGMQASSGLICTGPWPAPGNAGLLGLDLHRATGLACSWPYGTRFIVGMNSAFSEKSRPWMSW